MANIVENLGKLKRRVKIFLPEEAIQKEVDIRIKELAKSVRIPGFRKGKVHLDIIKNRYSDQVKEEVIDNKIRHEFIKISYFEDMHIISQLSPVLNRETSTNKGRTFDITFEVYPNVKIGDLMTCEIECSTTTIGQKEIDRTIDILRNQRLKYQVIDNMNAQEGNRLTVDFDNKIKGASSQGSTTKNFVFVLGERKVLPEFEQTVLGMKVGEVREFDIKLPDNYRDKKIAGKTREFRIKVKKIESVYLPNVDEEFAKSLGIENGDLERMRSQIKESLEYEAKRRTRSILKNQALNELLKISEFDLPEILIEQDKQNLINVARQNLTKRGIQNIKDIPIPIEIFSKYAERRVKLAIIVAELVKLNKIEAKPYQVREKVEELAKIHKDPKRVIQWFYSNKQRITEIEALVIENNVVDLILGKAKITHKSVSFEMLARLSENI